MTREEALKFIPHVKAVYGTKDFVRGSYAARQWFDVIEEALKQGLCEDAISRDAVLEPYKTLKDTDTVCVWLIRKNIEGQKCVDPARPKGKWIKDKENTYHCSVCGRILHKDRVEDICVDYPYCHCGAKMVNLQESEGL